jgi:hypothetical protein
MQARAVRFARYMFPGDEHYIEVRRRQADNLKPCSCYMCGNPRNVLGLSKHAGMTRQEWRAELDAEEQLESSEGT